jgi:two-component system LytT family sensor kinase
LLVTFKKNTLTVTANEFIFSQKRAHRIARHAAFWLAYYIYTVVISLPDLQVKSFADSSLYKEALDEALQFLPLYFISVYFSVYVILPKYLANKKVFTLILYSLLLIIVTTSLCCFISKILFEKYGQQWDTLDLLNVVIRKSISQLITITGAAIVIKILKDYFLRQQENELLAIENIRNKLHLQKMQLHPNILFESLNAIHNDIAAGTVYAPEMILRLSDMLSYLLYEADVKQILLSSEIKMIQNYTELKKLQYNNRLDIYFETTGDISSYYISPGLLLPFLEAGIATFEKLEKPLIVSIQLKTDESKIYFTLKNNIPGIQMMKMPLIQSTLKNIKDRLQIFYLHKFKLEIYPAAETFTVMLQLEPNEISHRKNQNIQNGQRIIYERT